MSDADQNTTTPADPGGRRLVGRVIKPHGLHGEVVVDPLTDVAARWEPGSILHGNRFDEAWTVATSRPHQGRVLVRFEGVASRNDAELLRALELYGDELDLSEYGTYFIHELIGMTVLDEDSQVLGEVTQVIELPPAAGYDLLEVTRPDGSTFQLPDADELVAVGVDDEGTEYLVVTDPPEGLLDGEPAVVRSPGEGG